MSDPMAREMNCGYGRTTTWRKLLTLELGRNQETYADLVRLECRGGQENEDFGFYAWTSDHVYASWSPGWDDEVISLPRNPPA